ncbi:MAG: hypothetical protein ISS82_04145 [Nanoarchaeota archaeon]|nr:hypothetical protein [Nanoarchaeota archaeon]
MIMENIIKVTKKEKITSIRVSESTKRELEGFGNSGNTHEEILKKLIKLAKSAFTDSETKLLKKGNIIGTKYGKLSRTFNIETEQNKYSIVCKFNDLSLMNLMLENKNLKENFSKEWEIDLEIINISVDSQKYNNKQKTVTWKSPNILYEKDKHEYLLLYLIAVKQVLEEMFSIKIYEITTQDDYFNIEKWKSAFIRNKLSMESFYGDVQRKMR